MRAPGCNPSLSMKQISRTKTIDAALFTYGVVATFFLTVNAINSLTYLSDLLFLALFMPVTAYFFLAIARFVYRRLHRFLNPGYFSNPPTSTYYFSLRTFVDQESRFFLVSLFLLTLAFCLALFRLSLSIWVGS